MKKYIDCSKIKYDTVKCDNWFGCQQEWEDRLVAYKEDIDAIPTADVVEVVYCKDCKWRPRNLGERVFAEHLVFPWDSDCDAVCPYAADDPWYNKEPDPDGYCHLGEREEDQHDS